jgi:glutathione S-transferase
MTVKLYAHPFSSYCQKVLTALYENQTPFEYCELSHDKPQLWAELSALWPFRKFPVLVDAGRTVTEATVIIEYLGLYHPGPVSLLPADPRAALEVRSMDRFFDNYISTPQQKIVADSLRAEGERDPRGVADAAAMLDTAYAWLDKTMAGREWADWTHRIDPSFGQVLAYRQRLLARPSFARAVEEARPFRPLFPLGAPDRD